MGDQPAAVAALRQAIALAEAAGDRREQAMATSDLGWRLGQMGDQPAAVAALRQAIALAEAAGDQREQAVATRHLGWNLGEMGDQSAAVAALRQAVALAEAAGDRHVIAWSTLNLVQAARRLGADAAAVAAWLRAVEILAAAPAQANLPQPGWWLDDVAVAGLRGGRFAAVWQAAKGLADAGWSSAGRAIAAALVAASADRAAAYAMAEQLVAVLAAPHDSAGKQAARLLEQVVQHLTRDLADPAVLRDIAALLAAQHPAPLATGRAMLEAAALRRENPDDPTALQRLDPDIAMAVDRVLGSRFAPAKPPRRRAARGTARKR